MKICHMTSVHDPEDVRIFHKECVSLVDKKNEVYLVESGDSYRKSGVQIVGVGDIPTTRLKRITIGAKKVFKKALELDADVYHFHDPELLFYGLKLKRKRKKVIFDCHENVADSILEKPYLPVPLRRCVRFVYKIIEKHVCSKLDAVITVTPTQTEYFKKINSNTVEVKNCPIIKESFTTPKYNKKAIVFAGGISRQWNHHILLDALKTIPDCTYVLVGQDNDYRKSLEDYPSWKQVEYLGRKNHSEVFDILSSCMVGVALLSPGNNTAGNIGTLGNTKIFEEMIAGLPVICTDFILWRQFVEDYNCGICVDPSNVSEVSKAIARLISDPSLCQEMGKNGQKAVKEKYNWDIEKVNLLKLYRRL